MKIYPQMFETIKNENEAKKHRGLTLIQKIKLAILELRIYIAMKKGEDKIYVSYIEDRLIIELLERGFSVKICYPGCASFLSDFTMYTIGWKIK